MARRIFSRIFSPDFFLLIFVGKSAQKNPPGKSPAHPPEFIQQKSPTHFCRGAGPIISNSKFVHNENLQATSRENGRKRFDEKSPTFSTVAVHQNKVCFFFTAASLGAGDPTILVHSVVQLLQPGMKSAVLDSVALVV